MTDDFSKRKEDIRQRLLEARHPRRATAVLSSDPDHNPLILEDCSACHGTGHRCDEAESTYILDACAACAGRGITGRLVRYFQNESPEIRDANITDGWLTCPWCGRRFTVRDSAVWSGRRHITCGGLIEITPPQNADEDHGDA